MTKETKNAAYKTLRVIVFLIAVVIIKLFSYRLGSRKHNGISYLPPKLMNIFAHELVMTTMYRLHFRSNAKLTSLKNQIQYNCASTKQELFSTWQAELSLIFSLADHIRCAYSKILLSR